MTETLRELLPCPFCGCHLYFDKDYHEGELWQSFLRSIKCPECPGGMWFYSSNEEQAIAAWNRRPVRESHDEALEAAAKVCDEQERAQQALYATWMGRVNKGNPDEPVASAINARISQSRSLAAMIRALKGKPQEGK